MPRSALWLVLLLAGCSPPPEEAALDGCKGAYDRFMRWQSLHGRRPETPAEEAEIVLPGRLDPWGVLYVLEVSDDGHAVIWSNGPDKRPDTGDDIRYPPE